MVSKKDSIRIALAQIDCCVGDCAANMNAMKSVLATALQHDVQLLMFPELTIPGYPVEDLALHDDFVATVQETTQEFIGLLREEPYRNIVVMFGTLGYDDNSVSHSFPHRKPCNRCLVVRNGEILAQYDKNMLPNYGVFDEQRIFTAGVSPAIVNLYGMNFALAICEDVWHDDGVIESLQHSHEQIDALLTINASPYSLHKQQIRFSEIQQRIDSLHVPVAYLNLVGGQDDIVFDGGSFVLDAQGNLVAQAPLFDEAMLIWDFIPSENSSDECSNHCDSKDTGTLNEIADAVSVDEHFTNAMGKYGELYCATVLGLRDYLRKNNFHAVTLGLSGGIDSALVATIAADALGSGEAIYGIAMPSMFSSEGSKDDAQQLADNLGIQYDVQPIETLFNAYQEQLQLSGIAAENLQARIRGVIVMAYSNSRNALPLATGNKSELACGYSTIYGDAVGGYAPIRDVLKTDVWAMARWRNIMAANGYSIGKLPIASYGSLVEIYDSSVAADSDIASGVSDTLPIVYQYATPIFCDVSIPQYMQQSDFSSDTGAIIPTNSIIKPPSAELRPGQKDSDSLPDYYELDTILHGYIEDPDHFNAITSEIDPETINHVLGLIRRAEWKRRQYPLGPKVSAVMFGKDRRYPITHHYYH